jgi:hypothetical protein
MFSKSRIILLFALALLAALGAVSWGYAQTGDVIDDFQYQEWACPGYVNVVWADIDSNGQWETQVVFFTIDGWGGPEQEFDGTGYWYFFAFQGDNPFSICAQDHEDRGRIAIHFVDLLAPGFDQWDPSTWIYKSVPSVSIRANHDYCIRPGADPGTAYQSVQAYRLRFQQGGLVTGTESSVGGWKQYDFADAQGISELYITTDFCENNLDNLILDGGPVNSAPVLAALPDRSLNEDNSLNNTIDLWAYASDAETADSGLTFSIDNTPNPNAGVSIDGNRYIDINPTANWYGSTIVRIKVADPDGASATSSFGVTVNSVNDLPVLSGLPNHWLQPGDSLVPAVDLWAFASDIETADQDLVFSIDNTPDPNAGVSIRANRYVDISLAAGWHGSTTVRIRATDEDADSDTCAFDVTVGGKLYLPTVLNR